MRLAVSLDPLVHIGVYCVVLFPVLEFQSGLEVQLHHALSRPRVYNRSFRKFITRVDDHIVMA